MTRFSLALALLPVALMAPAAASSAMPTRASTAPSTQQRSSAGFADSACIPHPAPDSARLFVTGRAQPDQRNLILPAEFLRSVVEAVRQHFVAPDGMSFPIWGTEMDYPNLKDDTVDAPHPRRKLPRRIAPEMSTDIYFTLRDSSGPTDVSVGATSLTALLQSALAQAVGAVRPQDYQPIPAGVYSRRIHLTLKASPTIAPGAHPFFTVTLPVYNLEREAGIDRFVRPEYPTEAQRGGISDLVVVIWVIGDDGRALPQTEELREGHYREFVQAVRKSIRASRYKPAIASGCPIKTVVEQPFVFKIWPG